MLNKFTFSSLKSQIVDHSMISPVLWCLRRNKYHCLRAQMRIPAHRSASQFTHHISKCVQEDGGSDRNEYVFVISLKQSAGFVVCQHITTDNKTSFLYSLYSFTSFLFTRFSHPWLGGGAFIPKWEGRYLCSLLWSRVSAYLNVFFSPNHYQLWIPDALAKVPAYNILQRTFCCVIFSVSPWTLVDIIYSWSHLKHINTLQVVDLCLHIKKEAT